MCGIVTQEQIRDERYGYTILGEYTNSRGDTALMVADYFGDISNIYSADGLDYYSPWLDGDNQTEQRTKAEKAMTKRGFLPVGTQATTTPIATVIDQAEESLAGV